MQSMPKKSTAFSGPSMWEMESKYGRPSSRATECTRQRCRSTLQEREPEIETSRKILKEVSDNTVKEGNLSIPQPIQEETEDASLDNAVDSEELKLRDQLQGVLNACAGSLGHTCCCSRSASARSLRRRQREASTAQASTLSGPIEARYQAVTPGRETPVRQNGSHEAELCLFPNGHSVAGEKDYLSPLAAILEAWKLRGDVIIQDIGHPFDLPALLSCEHQSSVPIYSSLKCNSQKPRNVRHCKKRVHFDDYIEFATQHGGRLGDF